MTDLDPAAAAFLARAQAAGARPSHEGTPQQARDAHNASAAAVAGVPEPVHSVTDAMLDGVPVRSYTPDAAAGTLAYLHGGGWVVGTLDTYDALCRRLANRSGARVVSVGYALAPEARHPEQVQQALAVVRALARAEPAGTLAVAGDSAGGHLAGLVSRLAVDEGIALVAAALLYPVVSPALDTGSARDNATGYFLETESMRWYWAHYLGESPAVTAIPVDLADQQLEGLPPTLVVTAGFDPLRDEGAAYAHALQAAGVEVEIIEADAQIHGFLRLAGVMPAAAPVWARVGDWLRSRLS